MLNDHSTKCVLFANSDVENTVVPFEAVADRLQRCADQRKQHAPVGVMTYAYESILWLDVESISDNLHQLSHSELMRESSKELAFMLVITHKSNGNVVQAWNILLPLLDIGTSLIRR